MSYCRHHHIPNCTECRKDAEYFEYWLSVNDLEDFVPTDHASVLITVVSLIGAIAALVFILEY